MSDKRADELAEALHIAQMAAELVIAENKEAQEQFMWAQQNRVGLLWVHGIGGALVGLLMLMYGSAYYIEEVAGIWSRVALGGVGFIGGMVLVVGLTRKPRAIPIEAAGIIILGLWDLALVIAFIAVTIQQPPDLLWPWQHASPDTSRPYALGVYGILLALLSQHAWTLRGLFKLRR